MQFRGTRASLPDGGRPNLFLENQDGMWIVGESLVPQPSHKHSGVPSIYQVHEQGSSAGLRRKLGLRMHGSARKPGETSEPGCERLCGRSTERTR